MAKTAAAGVVVVPPAFAGRAEGEAGTGYGLRALVYVLQHDSVAALDEDALEQGAAAVNHAVTAPGLAVVAIERMMAAQRQLRQALAARVLDREAEEIMAWARAFNAAKGGAQEASSGPQAGPQGPQGGGGGSKVRRQPVRPQGPSGAALTAGQPVLRPLAACSGPDLF